MMISCACHASSQDVPIAPNTPGTQTSPGAPEAQSTNSKKRACHRREWPYLPWMRRRCVRILSSL